MTTDTTSPSEPNVNDSFDDGLTDEQYLAAVTGFIGQETGPPVPAPDEVNQAMIRHWCEALGDTNPVYVDPEAADLRRVGSLTSALLMEPAWRRLRVQSLCQRKSLSVFLRHYWVAHSFSGC